MATSARTLSPRQAAQALGASESSLKRWIDAGDLLASRSAGGHRRLQVAEVLRFAQRSGIALRDGGVLGLAPPRPDRGLAAAVRAALVAGDEGALRRHLLAARLAGIPVSALADGPIRAAMAAIGRRWQHGPEGIAIEHRATLVAVRAVSALRDALPQPAPNAPLTVGGAPAGDPYLLPTLLAGLVLQEAGWRTIDLGPDTPDEALCAAARRHRASLVWLSCTAVPGRPAAALRALEAALGGVPLLVGGRSAPAAAGITVVGDMAALAAAARGLRMGA